MIWSVRNSLICLAPLFVFHMFAELRLVSSLQLTAHTKASSSNSKVFVSNFDERLTAHTNASQSISEGSLDKHNAHSVSQMSSSRSHEMDGVFAIQARFNTEQSSTLKFSLPRFAGPVCRGIMFIMLAWVCGWTVGWNTSRLLRSQLPMSLGAQHPQTPAQSQSSLSDEAKGAPGIVDPDQQPDLTWGQIAYAVLIYAPWLCLVTVIFVYLWIIQQILVLPFRMCGGRLLTSALNLFAPLMSSVVFVLATGSTGEACYGREIDRDNCKSFADFLKTCSASRRKNIKRNLKAAEQAMRTCEFKVSYCEAGSWRINSQMRAMVWDQCQLHVTRACGSADIVYCQHPFSSHVMYLVEMMLLLAFACDMQLIKTRDGKIVSMNTRVHLGDVLFNSFYACNPKHGRQGIYTWVGHDLVEQALRLRVKILNLGPFLRPAKKILGMRPLHLDSLICACWTCGSWFTRPEPSREEAIETKSVLRQDDITAVGGKQASPRKRSGSVAANTNAPAEASQQKRETTKLCPCVRETC